MGSPNLEPAASPDLSPELSPAPESSAKKGGKARMRQMPAAERSALGQKAAKARWGKKEHQARSAESGISKPKLKKAKKHPAQKSRREARLPGRPVPATGVFGVALMAAEERLACAIEERARAAAQWAVLQAEIPSLQRTIAALRNQQNTGSIENYAARLPDGSISGAGSNTSPVDYSLASVVSDGPAAPPPRPALGLAGGGAVDVNLGNQEDEDMFLRDSPVGRGEWR